MPTINLKLSRASCPIAMGTKQNTKLQLFARKYARNSRLFVIFDAQVYALHGERLVKVLASASSQITPFVLPQGEKAKSQTVLAGLYDYLLANKISRSDLILACGGGVTTDVAGYAAATILRGICWGAVPTTLLGMVDAAIGGKTGINHPLGKNLIGAIWQPSFVVCDLEFLQTLPRRELVAGSGELIKYAGLIGEPMLPLMREYLDSADLLNLPLLSRLMRLGIQYKADIVARDEREQNVRAYLNLGHTFGHAIEHALGFGKLLHGEAVILGLLGAVSLSEQLKPRAECHLREYRQLISRAIKLVPPAAPSVDRVLDAMALDKKRSLGSLRFVLVERPGKPYIAANVPRKQVAQAVEEMLAVYSQQGGRYAASAGRQRT